MKSFAKHFNQRGQGAVEYVLLLGLTVAIVLGIILQFNNAFKVFANNYFGDYLTCLLETGALPTLGGPDLSGGECQIKEFKLGDGDTGDGTGGNGGGGGGNDEGENDASEAPKKNPPATASADGNSAGSASVGSRARNGTRFAARPSGNGDEKGNPNSDEESTSANFNTYDRNKEGSKRFLLVESEEKRKRRLEDKKDKSRTKVKSDKTFADGRQGAPLLQKVLKRTPASDASGDDGFEFSFGNILRWLLIIALIIAIVIFIGGQILQVSKSVD